MVTLVVGLDVVILVSRQSVRMTLHFLKCITVIYTIIIRAEELWEKQSRLFLCDRLDRFVSKSSYRRPLTNELAYQ